jgi:uracil-DNA glycosylase
MIDFPKSLGDETIRRQRFAMLDQPHIGNFTALVKEIRRQEGFSEEVPYFDPMDGGAAARVLFLLEAPGLKAVQSGFVSRNNPDETAKNMFLALQDAALPRNATVLWNIVPWYLGSGSKIRPAGARDIEDGKAYVPRLLELLPMLKVVALVGRKAQRIGAWLASSANHRFKVLDVPHPSPLFVNNRPGNRDLLLKSILTVRQSISH